MKQSKLPPQDVVYHYTVNHLTYEEIGKLYGVTRQAVYKVIKKQGITTQQGEHVDCECAYCGKSFTKTRKRWKSTMYHYCSENCYFASRENPAYLPWRQGLRLARAIVGQHFQLQPGHVVHHVDGNNHNNNLSNLWVFASNAEHTAFHHGKRRVDPLWKGEHAVV